MLVSMVVAYLFQAGKWPVEIISGKILLQRPCDIVEKSNQGCNKVVLSCKHGCHFDLGRVLCNNESFFMKCTTVESL